MFYIDMIRGYFIFQIPTARETVYGGVSVAALFVSAFARWTTPIYPIAEWPHGLSLGFAIGTAGVQND